MVFAANAWPQGANGSCGPFSLKPTPREFVPPHAASNERPFLHFFATVLRCYGEVKAWTQLNQRPRAARQALNRLIQSVNVGTVGCEVENPLFSRRLGLSISTFRAYTRGEKNFEIGSKHAPITGIAGQDGCIVCAG